MDTWIYIIIFVIVPIINRVIEMKKARAEKAAAEAKRMMRKEARNRRGPAANQGPDSPAPVAMTEDTSWQTVDETDTRKPQLENFEPMTTDSPPVQEGWIQIPETDPNPVQGRIEIDTSPPPGLEIFSFPLPEDQENFEMDSASENTRRSGKAYEVELADNTQAYVRTDTPSGDFQSTSSASKRRSRFQLSKSELRERLVWREILGPPLSLRRDEEPLA